MARKTQAVLGLYGHMDKDHENEHVASHVRVVDHHLQ